MSGRSSFQLLKRPIRDPPLGAPKGSALFPVPNRRNKGDDANRESCQADDPSDRVQHCESLRLFILSPRYVKIGWREGRGLADLLLQGNLLTFAWSAAFGSFFLFLTAALVEDYDRCD